MKLKKHYNSNRLRSSLNLFLLPIIPHIIIHTKKLYKQIYNIFKIVEIFSYLLYNNIHSILIVIKIDSLIN